MFDKFHEECGVFAIYGHPEAANLAYLGLYALQHRGQESAGICHQRRRARSTATSPWGTWRISSRRSVLAELPGELAIGHTRYSTAGDTVLLNAQPFSVACNKGQHRGGAQRQHHQRRRTARASWKRDGSIFQASSDTEVILHLVAHSRERTLAGALREALLQLEGAFSLVFLARGPHHRGARSARLPSAGLGPDGIPSGRTCYVFASETCAFDLIGAVYLNDVEPGEMVIVGPEGMTRER